jgi:hypothetical protein
MQVIGHKKRPPACRRLFPSTDRLPLPWVFALALMLSSSVLAAALEPVTVRSQSGHFVVRGLPMGRPLSGYSTSEVQYLRLDPMLTAVSLERIREAITGELGFSERQRGSTITVATRPVEEDRTTVTITSVRYTDGWGYRVSLPERIEKDRFVQAAVRVILLEIANRKAHVRETELPPWLAEGLAAQLQITSLITLALEPETQVARREINRDPMRAVRELLRRRSALTLDDLSMPTAEQISGDDAALYRACAHVFVRDLLRLRTGRDCLRSLLVRLPENLNWQTTFLDAFKMHFQSLLDVDKWYALNIVTFSGRDPASVWPLATTRRQLDEILSTAVQVRLDATELPISTDVKLQRIIAEWDFPRQHTLLSEKLARLAALRQRAHADLVTLVNDYWIVLDAYGSDIRGKAASGKKRAGSLTKGERTAISRLEELDRQREQMLPRTAEAVPAR